MEFLKDWQTELSRRIKFVREVLYDAHAKGIVYGNSGGKDCTLVSIICKLACDNTLGVIMPCSSAVNYSTDMQDALVCSKQFNIPNITVDLTSLKQDLLDKLACQQLSPQSISNIAPRLRMTTLYSIAQTRGCVVAGTGNACELYMGYFTKWGDGASDFNCIADLTVSEVYDFLRYLNAPSSIISKRPSAGLYEGQTDENELGVTYDEIEKVMMGIPVSPRSQAIIERYHTTTCHKRIMPKLYKWI
ncbi:MAG: NAD(+) synthase [Clostridia bacterium]